MLEAIALLAPSLIALKIYNNLQHNRLDTRALIMSYGIFVVAINLCLYSIILYLLEVQSIVFSGTTFVKYTILASVMALIIPFVIRLIESTISIRVVPRDEKQK